MPTAHLPTGHRMATRPRAALAMAPDAADGILDAGSLAALAELTELAPLPALTDLTTARARRVLADTELLITGWGCPSIDERVLAIAPRLRAIVHTAGSVRGHVGSACWERGIEVSSAATANALPVAEYTLAMILLANKGVLESARDYRAARAREHWQYAGPGQGNYRRTVGVLSASLIGRRVIELLRPYDLEVLLYDPYVSGNEAAALGVRATGLAELFALSDVVSVHTPLLAETRGLVSRELLAALRQDATLINTARGAVVDQDALTEALLAGRIRAVLDVTDPEVLPPDHPLWTCDNVLLTPHIAGSQGAELRRLTDLAISEVRRWARGDTFAHRIAPDRATFLA
ncbi:hydroxyacid dehydrogenase [Streptomyces zagrosensis]|uniref:Phosphoglycerate dehydrogenase-like enzyme n=1 Tax=Streptomyces zagrosensis TaxID=1042984 RepID=A0A7W9V2M2_9ACTN|nr:hydroxyacid dehydrogenase [Streptomyces zagrosensis]MBB5939436.1 phosphoglycerate dehydrogenase-like enzyme [Streptomyces zagrosensis]